MEHLLGLTNRQPWRFLHYQFNLDRELNVSTWVATLLPVVAAALLGTIAWERRLAADRRYGYWVVLSALFLLLSLDEMCSFHERLSEPVQDYLTGGGGLLTNAWVFVVVPVAVVILAAFVPFLRTLPAVTRWRFIAAGALFVAGAAGVELVSGLMRDRYGFGDARLVAATTLEELLELVGIAYFLRALVLYMAETRVLEHLVLGSRGAGGGGAERTS